MADRDELLRQIGKAVIGRADSDGFMWAGDDGPLVPICPHCGTHQTEHTDDCPLIRYLEATDE